MGTEGAALASMCGAPFLRWVLPQLSRWTTGGLSHPRTGRLGWLGTVLPLGLHVQAAASMLGLMGNPYP